MTTLSKTFKIVGAGLLGATMLAGPALATQGYFPHAFGIKSKGVAGSDVAFAQSAMTIAMNPAGLSDLDDHLTVGISAFSPNRKFSATPAATGSVTSTGQTSKNKIFGIPNFGVSKKLSDRLTVGFALYAAGGMNTEYTLPVFGAGTTGINLMQVGLSPAFSYKVTDAISIGIAPIFSISQFKAKGLGALGVTTSGTATAYGLGGRAGIQVKPSDMFSFGGYYQSRIYMSKFKRYANLFAQQGDFDIPASAGLGIAFKPMSALTLTGSYKHIWYSKVKSIANPVASPGALGANNGPGFGWDDVDVLSVGATYDVNDRLTVRAGYAYNNNPIGSTEVMFNILAPATLEHHITGGLSYKLTDRTTLDLAVMYAPEGKSQGTVVTNASGATSIQTITDRMWQAEASAGITWKF